mmetsp:Transcript_12166/g.21996  ORF Transcript_12166/g.21996 Transcript_12166/m.21996 type:complete len:606 (-) Transcript_12166:254-2071(-)
MRLVASGCPGLRSAGAIFKTSRTILGNVYFDVSQYSASLEFTQGLALSCGCGILRSVSTSAYRSAAEVSWKRFDSRLSPTKEAIIRRRKEFHERLWTVSPKMCFDLSTFCKTQGIPLFQDWSLLLKAISHSSFSFALCDIQENYQRNLALIGDQVLGLVTASLTKRLYHTFDTSQISNRMSCQEIIDYQVSNVQLAKIARKLELNMLIRRQLDEIDEERGFGHVLAMTYEAVLGAIYIEHGLDSVYDFVAKSFEMNPKKFDLAKVKQSPKHTLYKILQFWKGGSLEGLGLSFLVLSKDVRTTHKPVFTAAAVSGTLRLSTGHGPNLETAEQNAAQNAILAFQENDLVVETPPEGERNSTACLQLAANLASNELSKSRCSFSAQGNSEKGWTIGIEFLETHYKTEVGPSSKKDALNAASAQVLERVREEMRSSMPSTENPINQRSRFKDGNLRTSQKQRNVVIDDDALASSMSVLYDGSEETRNSIDRLIAKLKETINISDVESFERDSARVVGAKLENLWSTMRASRLLGLEPRVQQISDLHTKFVSPKFKVGRASVMGFSLANSKNGNAMLMRSGVLLLGLMFEELGLVPCMKYLSHISTLAEK